jgi:cystathionine beta-synthase
VVGEIDLLRHLVAGGQKAANSSIEALVESDYATVTPDTKLELLQGVLAEARAAIVVERDAVVGILTKIDLIEYLAKKSVESVAVAIDKPKGAKVKAAKDAKRTKKPRGATNGAPQRRA